jgi:hypothetical protein
MDATPNQAEWVGKSLAIGWSLVAYREPLDARFSAILSNRAEAGYRFGE